MIRCLLVDDDAEVQALAIDYLRRFGIDVSVVLDGAAMREALKTQRYDILLLDLVLSNDHGVSLFHWLRQHARLPVIVLNDRTDLASRVLCLEVGADDCLQKPFEPRELVARMRALLRRSTLRDADTATEAPLRLAFDGWLLDRLQRQLLTPDGQATALSDAESRLLAALAENPGHVLSRDRLLDRIRGPGAAVTDRHVDLLVSRLRHKLGHDPARASTPRIITLRGQGYALQLKGKP